MRFPCVRQINRPVYVFSEDGANTHVDKFRGLLRFSPLRAAPIPNPHYLFIFSQDDRDYANQLYFALRNGMASFPAPINSSESRSARIVWKPYGFLEGSSSQIKSESFTRSSAHTLNTYRRGPISPI